MVAHSSAKRGLRETMVQWICELLWLKIILLDLQVRVKSPIMLYYNNEAARNIPHNSVQYDWTKHVEIDRHFIKENHDFGQICISYVYSPTS